MTNLQETIENTEKKSIGEIIADKVAETVGSWHFILIQSTLIVFWIIVNTIGIADIPKWDPFPFIFLNLALSFQAAYTAPIIMMSQNREEKRDREQAKADYEINKLAENEVEDIQGTLERIAMVMEKQEQKMHARLQEIHTEVINLKTSKSDKTE